MRLLAAVPPVTLDPVGQLTRWRRLRLAAEILTPYPGLLRKLQSNDLTLMVAAARAVPGRVRPVPIAEQDATAVRLGHYVRQVMAPLPTDKRCLIRSLVLIRVLAARGIPAEVVIGVEHDGTFGAHAWVEYGSRPILPAGSFHRLTTL